MALPNIILKRYNGSTYDELYPKTSTGQVEGLSTALGLKINTSEKGAANGVATLDASSKLTYSQIPSFLLTGGTREFGVLGSATHSLNDIVTALKTTYTANGYTSWTQLYGSTWMASKMANATTELTWLSDAETGSGTSYMLNPGDEGDVSSPVVLENGDILIFVKYTAAVPGTANEVFQFAINSSQYGQANTVDYGITRLSTSTSTATTGSNVITDGILNGLIGTGANKIAAGNHNHSSLYQPLDTDLTAIAGLTPADDTIIVGNGTTWVAETGATARASLGLTIGTHVQGYDAGLQSIAGLTTAADRMIYTTASDTYAVTTLTSFGRSLIDDADAAAARTTLGLVIGTNVQAYDADLAEIAALTKTSGNMIYTNGTAWLSGTPSDIRTNLSVYSTTQVDNLLTNRPVILYDSLTATVTGTLVIDVI